MPRASRSGVATKIDISGAGQAARDADETIRLEDILPFGKSLTVLRSRGPILILGPISKVEDRSKDPDLRIA